MKMQITPEDHLKGSVIDPGWYPCIVKDEEEKVAKTDGSAYSEVKLEITDGPFKGVVLYTNFSEKAPGFAIEFLKACGYNLDPKKPVDVDLHACINKALMVSVKRGEWNGRPKNEVNGYRAK